MSTCGIFRETLKPYQDFSRKALTAFGNFHIGDYMPKNIQEHNFLLTPIYCLRMAPPIPVKKSGPKGKGKPEVRPLKRKRVTEDHEKLQRNVEELVSDCLLLKFYIVINTSKGPEDTRY